MSKAAENKGGLFIVIMLLPLGKEHLQTTKESRWFKCLRASGAKRPSDELTEISDG